MVVSLIVILAVAGIAFFHYKQGFFSAALSAMLAIIAAVVAFSYHEVVVRLLLQGRMPEIAHALTLAILFVAVYGILRVIFDKYVPGNLAAPLMVDRIGAGLMGVVAGVFAVGIFLTAVQTLPFGPSILGYSRYQLLPPAPMSVGKSEASLNNALKSDTINEADQSHLLLPVDDIVVNVVSHLSEGGSLAGVNPVAAIHPSYLDEAFFQRLGTQSNAKHVALNAPNGNQSVSLEGLFSPINISVQQFDSDVDALKSRWQSSPPPKGQFKPDAGSTLLIARVQLSGDAADSDGKVRLSPAAARLVANERNHFPIGTLDYNSGNAVLRINRPDDFLVVAGGGKVDFVYLVPHDDMDVQLVDPKNKAGPLKIGSGPLLEIKRLGFIDLSDKQVKQEMPPALAGDAAGVLRKDKLPGPPKQAAPTPAPGATPGAPAAPSASAAPAEAPFEYVSLDTTGKLPSAINVNHVEGDPADVEFGTSTATAKEKKFAQLRLSPDLPFAQLGRGDMPIQDLWVPAGMKAVQVIGTPAAKTTNAWEAIEKLPQFDVTDISGASYKPRGVWAKLKEGTEDKLVARYNSDADITSGADVPHSEGRPTDIGLIFIVPQNATLQDLRFGGAKVAAINKPVG